MNVSSRDETELKTLLRDIENNKIDKTDWLRKKEVDAIISRRLQRPEPQKIIDKLIISGYVETMHRDYGLDYMELRNTLYGALNARTSAFMFKLGDASLRRNNAETVYKLISREIGGDAENTVIRALEKPADPPLKYAFICNVYRVAFEALEIAIDNALKAVSEQKEKEVAE